MPKKKITKSTSEVPIVKIVKEEVVENKKSFDVFDNNGVFVRTYQNEVHGKEAKELAKQFALKINGEVK